MTPVRVPLPASRDRDDRAEVRIERILTCANLSNRPSSLGPRATLFGSFRLGPGLLDPPSFPTTDSHETEPPRIPREPRGREKDESGFWNPAAVVLPWSCFLPRQDGPIFPAQFT